MMMILLTYHITNNILEFFQSVYLTLSFWSRFLWHLLGPSSKGQNIFYLFFNTHAPARSLQQDDLWSIHTSRRLTCHHYNHQLSSGIQVRGDSKHQAQPINQSFVAAINAATSYNSRSFPASKVVQPHSIWSYIATRLFPITHVGMYINHNDIHNDYSN